MVFHPRESLTDVLEDQLRELTLDNLIRRICLFLIGNLDDKGYLRVDFTHVCKRFNVSEDKVEQSLQVLQSLDPTGIGARSLEECLRIQLLRMKESDPIALKVVDNFLPEIAAGRYRQVAKELGCDVTRIQEAVDQIKTLNPKPGITYTVRISLVCTTRCYRGKSGWGIQDCDKRQLYSTPFYSKGL